MPEVTSKPFEPLSAARPWRSKVIRFRCNLSYLKLFELKFDALETNQVFDPERPASNHLIPPIDVVPAGYDVIVERHHLLTAPIPVVQRHSGFFSYVPRQMPHFYTDLRGGPSRAFHWMSSKTRSTLARRVRSFTAFCGGELRWGTYKAPNEMAEFYRVAREVARKTYQERLFDAGLPDSGEFRTRMLELAGRDSVRGYVLFHGTRPIAYLYTPAPDGFLVYEYLGYDPEYAGHSPGTVLQYLALESCYREQRFPMYYWGYGFSQTKQLFSTGQVFGADIFYFRPTLRNRLAIGLHYAIDRLSGHAGALLNSVGLKERIKRRLKGQRS